MLKHLCINVIPVDRHPGKDKPALAAYYKVGIRTIENWLSRHIIRASGKCNRLEFDLADCDDRLMSHNKEIKNTNMNINTNYHILGNACFERRFFTKAMMARHYEVSARTITNWMRLGLLVYFKIKNVVRFDLDASDAMLKHYNR